MTTATATMTETALSKQTAKGERVVVRCLNSNKILPGSVVYSGPSSTPGCWRIDVMPDDTSHPVRPIIRAWKGGA